MVAHEAQLERSMSTKYLRGLTPSSRRRLRLPLRLLPLALDEGGHRLSRGILDLLCSCPIVRLVLLGKRRHSRCPVGRTVRMRARAEEG